MENRTAGCDGSDFGGPGAQGTHETSDKKPDIFRRARKKKKKVEQTQKVAALVVDASRISHSASGGPEKHPARRELLGTRGVLSGPRSDVRLTILGDMWTIFRQRLTVFDHV